jgi:chromate reductase
MDKTSQKVVSVLLSEIERLKKELAGGKSPDTALRSTVKDQSSPTSELATLKVLAFAGSARKASCNAGLLRVAAHRMPENVVMELVDISTLPLFNPELEKDLPKVVQDFQQRCKDADAFLMACPEYNFSMSGIFKNAIDWGSRMKGAFEGKVGAVMGAGGGHGTMKAQYHFRQTALFLNLRVVIKPAVEINAFEKDAEGNFVNCNLTTGDLVNEGLQDRVGKLFQALCDEARLWCSD